MNVAGNVAVNLDINSIEHVFRTCSVNVDTLILNRTAVLSKTLAAMLLFLYSLPPQKIEAIHVEAFCTVILSVACHIGLPNYGRWCFIGGTNDIKSIVSTVLAEPIFLPSFYRSLHAFSRALSGQYSRFPFA